MKKKTTTEEIRYLGRGEVVWIDAWIHYNSTSLDALKKGEIKFDLFQQRSLGDIFESADGKFVIIIHNYLVETKSGKTRVMFTVVPKTWIAEIKCSQSPNNSFLQ